MSEAHRMIGLFGPNMKRPSYVGFTSANVLQQSWLCDSGGIARDEWSEILRDEGWKLRVVMVKATYEDIKY